ncbi:MAG: hypothetical protein LBO06_01830, partial [Bacteroidales bacterium]|nr:hypothetical protein [Bacteroidales bacterium]
MTKQYQKTSSQFTNLMQQNAIKKYLNRRADLYKQMNSIVMEQSPVVVLYYDQVLRFSQKNIEGLESNP